MPDLSVIDLAMFLLERRSAPTTSVPLAIIAPPANFRGNFADKLLERMLRRSVGAPFNYRLGRSAAGIPKLDIDDQADARKARPAPDAGCPTSMDELCATVSKLHEVRIDRSGLLWELYVIDGLEGSRSPSTARFITPSSTDARSSRWSRTGLSRLPLTRPLRALWEGVPQVPQGPGETLAG